MASGLLFKLIDIDTVKIDIDNLSILLLSIKDKPLLVQKRAEMNLQEALFLKAYTCLKRSVETATLMLLIQ